MPICGGAPVLAHGVPLTGPAPRRLVFRATMRPTKNQFASNQATTGQELPGWLPRLTSVSGFTQSSGPDVLWFQSTEPSRPE